MRPRFFLGFAAANLLLAMPLIGAADDATVLTKINVVDAAKPAGNWSTATIGQLLNVRDRLRTGEESRASARLGDASILQVDELTTIEILPSRAEGDKGTLNLKQGSSYFFSREKAREIRFETPAANGAIRGTEFLLEVTKQLRTNLVLLKGEVELSNAHGQLVVHGGEQAEATADALPTKKPISGQTIAAWHLLLESKLSNHTLRSAKKQELVNSICASIEQWRAFAPQLVKTGVSHRREFTHDIVARAVGCIGPGNCDLIARVVAAASSANADEAARIVELAIEKCPGCQEALESPAEGPEAATLTALTNQNPAPGSAVGNSNSGCVVCHNNQNISLACDKLETYLQAHPGDTTGACQATPNENR